MTINASISDLFFNRDFSAAIVTNEKGQFERYDEARLLEEAQDTLDCLERLGVMVPPPDALIADFYSRL